MQVSKRIQGPDGIRAANKAARRRFTASGLKQMHISTRLAAAAFAVATIVMPNLATAAGSATPTPPSEAPSSVVADGGKDGSKVYAETGTEDFLKTRPHDGGVRCFDDPLGQHVLWIWNNSE